MGGHDECALGKHQATSRGLAQCTVKVLPCSATAVVAQQERFQLQ